MAGVFAQVEVLESKYGIRQVEAGTGNEVGPLSPPLTETDTTAKYRRKRDVLRRFGVFWSGPGGADIRKIDSTLKKPSLLKPNLKAAASSTPNLNSSGSPELIKYTVDSDLEITAPRMPEVVEGIEKKAKLFHETLSSYGRFEWAFSTKEELGSLIGDLKEFNDALIKLTAPFTSRGEIPFSSKVLD
jgi:hypothetical protein